MEGNSQGNVSNNQTESSNGEGSGTQVSNIIKHNNIRGFTQNIYNNAGPSTSSSNDIVIDYCPVQVPTFICREEELEELKKLYKDHQVIVLMGMGRLGKTQLSCKSASVNKSDYRHRYWLESETTQKLDDSFNDLAKKLHVTVSNKNVRVNDVYKALENIPTLLIFDNVEKPADVYNYLPTRVEMTSAKVHVLITSRWTVWTRDTVKCYPLKPLNKQAAQQLFKKNFGEAYMKVDESLWQELANNLGHLPLALQVAASYIIERHDVNSGLVVIVTKYIDQLAKGAKRLLTDPLVDYNNKSIYSSMMLILELIEKMQADETKQAVSLTNMACYMDPDKIFKYDLLQIIEDDDKGHMLDEVLVILTKFALMNKVNTEYDDDYYTMHRVIQRSIRYSQTEKNRADNYYTMTLNITVHNDIYCQDYIMSYADERASCVYRYYYAYPSSTLIRHLVYSESCVALRKILDSMDKTAAKSKIYENKYLLLSAEYSNIDMVQLLHEYGADIKQKDDDGNTSLHISCIEGHSDIAQWLLKHGADPCATNKDRRTPAHLAAIYKQAGILDLVLEWDKSVADLKDHSGYTPLHYILNSIHFFDDDTGIDFANVFFKYGGHVTQMAETGESIIHIAAKHALSKLVSHILKLYSSKINIVDKEGRTLLQVVGDTSRELDEYDIVSTIEVLIEHGLPLDTQDNQARTILHTVSRCCYPQVISFILQKNSSLINMVDNEGRTSLHVVGDTSHKLDGDAIVSTIKDLIEYGLSLDTKDNLGRTILHTVSRLSYPQVISFILQTNPSLINITDVTDIGIG